MLVVSAERAVVIDQLRAAGGVDGDVVIANENAPRQFVLSGPTHAIEAAHRQLSAAKIAAQRLQVSTAFHSPIVAPARGPLGEFLATIPFTAPRVPVYCNATTAPYSGAPHEMRALVAGAIVAPVRFVEQIEAMYAAGARIFIEVGPQAVLSKLVSQILEGRAHTVVALDQRGKDGVTALWEGLGRLATLGVPLRLSALDAGEPATPRTVPSGAFAVTVGGANIGKPYPPPVDAPVRPPIQVAQAPAPIAQTPAPPAIGVSALHALERLQAPIIAAQAEYQRVLAASHAAFLRATEASYAALGAGGIGASASAPHAVDFMAPPPRAAVPVRPQSPSPAPVAPLPVPAAPTRPAPPVAAAPLPNAKPVEKPIDLGAFLVSVVAEKTGYPTEMLGMSMDLEAELGIDSIKRVEILSAIRTRRPDLPEIDPSQLSSLRTLEQILRYLDNRPDAPVAEAQRASELTRLEVRAVDATSIGFATPGFAPGQAVVVMPDDSLGRAVAVRLEASGVRVTVLNVVDEREIHRLAQDEKVSVICLAGDGRDVFRIARVLATADRPPTAFVTVQDTRGDFALGASAIAKCFGAERPETVVRTFDVEGGGRADADIARAIVDELLAGGPEMEIVLRADGHRSRIDAVPAVAVADTTIDEGAFFIVSGGARGVTAATLVKLAHEAKPRLLLLGRTVVTDEDPVFAGVTGDTELKRVAVDLLRRNGALPTPREVGARVGDVIASREIRENLRRLEEAGAHARYVGVDVRDREAVAAIVDATRREWGPVRGVIHGAGVIADALLQNKTDDQFEQVVSTKVGGLTALLDATRDDPLRWLCVFSSISARTGNAGQSDYAMANEIASRIAEAEGRRRGDGLIVRSICWGPWDGGMVDATRRKRFLARGVELIPLEAGAHALVAELRTRGSSEAVVAAGSRVDAPTRRAEIVVDRASFPELDSHRVQGNVVLPVVMAVEWFARMTSGTGRAVFRMRDVHVKKGVVLTSFDGMGERLGVESAAANGGVRLTLRDGAGISRVEALLDGAGPPASLETPESLLTLSPWGERTVYGPAALFHGPAFQVVERIVGVSPQGASAWLKGSGRGRDHWSTDAAALDGALQLAFLWGMHTLDRPTLPLRIGSIDHRDGAASARYRCELRIREHAADRVVCDLWVISEAGVTIATMRGVEMYAVPGGTAGSAV